jgi:hypothetical protein
MELTTKVCKKCQLDKPRTEFNKHNRAKDRLHVYCKPCQKEYSHNYDMKRKTAYNYDDPFYKENKKVCPRCDIEKTLFEFTRDYKGTNGLKSYCNDCRKPYYKKLKKEDYNPVVYNIINKLNGEVLYVGETETPQMRKDKHFSTHAKSPISRRISKGELDVNSLSFEIIEQVEDKITRRERETYWIREKKPRYNIMKVYKD